MLFKYLAAGCVAALSLGSPVFAATLDVNSISGVWQNASPSVTGEGKNIIRWGEPAVKDGKRSGYKFRASDDMSVSDEAPFVLGTFTHLNFPIMRPVLKSVDLALSFKVAGVSEAITSVFSFKHLETRNEKKMCANGDRNGVGVNTSAGCADRVTATVNEAKSETFKIDGVTYALDITGFQYGGETLSAFWTSENKKNRALLIGSFRVVSTDVPEVPEVPLPASGVLLLGGLAGLAMARRRKA